MKNLINAITAEQKTRLNDFITTINKVKSASELNTWQYNDLMPKGKKLDKLTIKEAKAYLITRKEKTIYKTIEKEVSRINAIAQSGKLVSVKISVEWKKSRMWGMNPSAECWATFINKEGNTDSVYVQSGSIGGCGYDKLSTAVAQCLNQINPLLKALYLFKNKNIAADNRELLGYGSGYGILPSFEGGVGVSCYPKIFDKIGFKFERTASGKTFDVFTITKSK